MVPVKTSVDTPGVVVTIPVVASCVKVAAGTLIWFDAVVNRPVAVL